MPFTGSHPAAVIPLMGTPLVPSALVIASMVPDLPYYVPLPVSFSFTHTIGGLLTVDVAMAAACFAAWHLLLAPVSVALSPEAFRARLAPELPRPWSDAIRGPAVPLVVASIIVGALTHVVWDAFTHVDHWGPRHIPWLAERHGSLEGFRWAQYASGFVGMVVIAVAAMRWWRRTPTDPRQRISRLPRSVAVGVWSAVITAGALGGTVAFASAMSHDEPLSRALYRAATDGGGAGLLVAFVCAAWCAYLLRHRESPAGSATPN